jgi:hypothetical protein
MITLDIEKKLHLIYPIFTLKLKCIYDYIFYVVTLDLFT